MFTQEEKVFLVLEYEKNNDIRHIRYLFREKFGRNRPVPGRMLIPRLHKNLKLKELSIELKERLKVDTKLIKRGKLHNRLVTILKIDLLHL